MDDGVRLGKLFRLFQTRSVTGRKGFRNTPGISRKLNDLLMPHAYSSFISIFALKAGFPVVPSISVPGKLVEELPSERAMYAISHSLNKVADDRAIHS